MISSAADYEFVTGIQDDEIVIDGDILPVRDTYQDPEGIQQPRCLRGEDVAFLMEAANERNSVIAGQAEVSAFSRSVSASQLSAICTNLHRHVVSPSNASTSCYFKKDYAFSEKHYAYSDLDPGLTEFEYYSDAEDLAPARLYPDGVLLDKSASPGDFQNGGTLRLDKLRNLFTDVGRQRRMYCGNQNLWSGQELGNPGTISSSFYRDVNRYGPGSGVYPPINNPYDDTNVLFYNTSQDRFQGIYETHTLASFSMDLPISAFASGYLSQVTVLVAAYCRSYWNVDSGSDQREKRMAVIPLSAVKSGGAWTLPLSEAEKVVDKMAAAMARPIRGSSVWPSSSRCLQYAFVGLLGATPIVTLGDHTDF